jgi:hypothetical protein
MNNTNFRAIDWVAFFKGYGLVPRAKRQRKNKGNEAVNVYAAFDIETTTVWTGPENTDAHSFMYIWQYQIEDFTFKGRTWEEWFEMLAVLQSALEEYGRIEKISKPPVLISWIHNAAFEFSWISGLYPFTDEECFFRDVRKPIYFRMFGCFEFRCSYIQTNLSLKALCKHTGVKPKLSGQEFDYNKIRFPWTELTAFEEEYATTDVESLVKAMKIRIQKAGDTLLTVPLTSTGYVRRDCKEALKDRYLEISDLKPWRGENAQRVYKLLRAAFRGGNTHGNRYRVNQICDDVYSYDIASSYPTQQLTQKFPMKPFKWLDGELTIERVCMFIGLGYAVVGEYHFINIRLKDEREPIPYISLARCEAQNFQLDNGRVLKASYLEISLTEIDLEIILSDYEFDKLEITQAMISKKDYLPPEYRAVIQDYYTKKTALKGDETEEGKYMYTKSKNSLNSVYGMSATDPIHQEVKYNGGDYLQSGWDSMTNEEIEKNLKRAAFPYQWGVYTTALARKQLQSAIKLCCREIGPDRVLYVDTDSIKTIGPAPIDRLNDELRDRASAAGAYADDMNGQRHYIGVFEQDAHYQFFITQGAKRYAFIKDNGRMGVTVAGVSTAIDEKTEWIDKDGKKYNPSFAVEELKSLDRFKPGMIWKAAGGTTAVYNDNDDFYYTDQETGKKVHITKNVAIIPTTYEMTYAKDYKLLLDSIQLYTEFRKARE